MSGHVRKRGEKSWELKFDLGTDPVSGKRIVRYVSFKGTKREAQAELVRLLNQKNEGTYIDPSKMTVGEYLEHWLSVGVGGWAAKTADRHRGIVRKNIIPRLGAIPLRKLTAVHIEAFEADLQRKGRLRHQDVRGGGLTAQTVLHVHRTLSQALAHAVGKVLSRNPCDEVKPPKPPCREIRILTKPEIARLLHALAGKPLYVPVLVGVTTGLRRGELFGLRWSDLDLDRGRLTVNQSLEWIGNPKAPHFKSPKTKTSRRTITLPALTVEALRAHKAEQAVERLRLGLGKPDLVFTRVDGAPVSLDYVTRAFGELVARLGLTPITLHGLRHTHISHQLMDGVHVKIVSERAGHSNVSITLSAYTAFLPNMQDAAAQGVDAWLRVALVEQAGGNPVVGGSPVAIGDFGGGGGGT